VTDLVLTRQQYEVLRRLQRRRMLDTLAGLQIFDPKPKEIRRCREFAQSLEWRCA
jgi:hypothetical protein